MLDTFRKLYELLEPRERRRGALVVLLTLFMGVTESARVGSVLPFATVLASSDSIASHPYLMTAYDWFGFDSTDQFVVFLGVVLFLVTVGALAFAALCTWVGTRYTERCGYTLSRRLFENYLHHPYEWFLGRHSADLGKSILSEVTLVVGGALMPAMQILTNGIVIIFLFALLVAADPVLAVAATSALGAGYWFVFFVGRRYLARIGEDRLRANRERFTISPEAFAGIKDVKLRGLENTFVHRFEGPSRRFTRHQATSVLIASLPQYALQALAFAILLLIVWYQIGMRGNLSQAIPIIALYALAASRLMPAFQKLYRSATGLKFSKPALDALHRDLVEAAPDTNTAVVEAPAAPSLRLSDRLEITAVSYRYPGASNLALDDVTLTIPARATVGLVGRTGAGKTTLVDVVLGLLTPECGGVRIDGRPITASNLRAWQRSAGYVPQHIFLADDTIAANIAFGVPRENIDPADLERAARIANLHDFVSQELEQGYDTLVGERGIRLSGGQRQRLGIARALYNDPDVLVFDEGTSALDNITERAVMEAVDKLANRKTIILIAHRLTTVRNCDRIFLLERGRLLASGTYDELVTKNEHFRDMAANVA
jgi:ABC-type multidrug transport system fused ATPase/permease subunit